MKTACSRDRVCRRRGPRSWQLCSEANQLLRDHLKLPAGYSIAWSGQYEAMQRVKQRLKLMVPITLFLICFLLYSNTGSIPKR